MSNNQAALSVLIRDSLIETPDENLPSIDVFMFQVQFRPDADKALFLTVLNAFLEPGGGVWGDMTFERLKEGPSYIEWGGWVGDQREALLMMALGQHHGLWTVVTPLVLGFERDSEEAKKLAGLGMVMISGFKPEVLT